MESKSKNNTLTIFLEGRIDTQNAPEIEKELFTAAQEAPGMDIVLDAEQLEYISSAGLRVLMMLRKKLNKALPVINVSPQIYEIFDVTGFTQILDVHKRLRRISVDGLPVIGQGATAKVYRLDRETIVKVFHSGTDLKTIQKEKEYSKNAFVVGVPTAISYDLVQVDDAYGSVYELLDAQDFTELLEKDKEHLEEQIRRFAHTMRQMHQLETDPDKFPSGKAASIQRLPYMLMTGVCTQDEMAELQKIYENVPDRTTFIHGDCHPGNVMVQNGEFIFIDMTNCGSGHPVFDMLSMCMTYHMKEVPGGRDNNPMLRSFTEEERSRIWKVFLSSYFDTKDEAFLEKAEKQITAVASVSALFVASYIPGLYSPSFVNELKASALVYVEAGLEPLCF